MSKLLSIKIESDEFTLGYLYKSRFLEDRDGQVLRSAKAMLLLGEDVDAELLAEALSKIAATLREKGLRRFLEEDPTEEYPPPILTIE